MKLSELKIYYTFFHSTCEDQPVGMVILSNKSFDQLDIISIQFHPNYQEYFLNLDSELFQSDERNISSISPAQKDKLSIQLEHERIHFF